jgi:type II secretory pathway pseudopilin PulG
MFHAAPRPAAQTNGLTLIEVVLVLSLLVVVAAISVPYLNGAFSRAHLNSSSDVLRDAWSRARLAAMQTGETHVFRFEPKGARYQIVPLDKLSLPEANELTPDDPDAEHSPHDMLRLSQARLPDNVIFAAGDIAASNQVAALLGAPSDETWSAPILFNPDGTTSDASVLLQNDRGQTIRVTLRGMTGIATASDVGMEAAL